MYLALYRKMRPVNFSDIIGQKNTVRTLINQILNSRISHAYLFCGTRGTGKTSTAKVFAKAVNCQSPVNGEPCNVCDVCRSIMSGASLNVIEIDAASNNRVDDVRGIIDEVEYPPSEGRYRVYIIDEVHMLTNSAFNALLKTLEEPPAHVVFILATTDAQKIPPTVLSRCQRFDFKRVTRNDMFETIRAQGLSIEDNALRYVISLADGSMRDAYSLLDQCLSFYSGDVVTLSMVQDLVGSGDTGIYFDFIRALFGKSVQACLEIINNLFIEGRSFEQFTSELITHLRNTYIAASVANSAEIADISDEQAALYKELSQLTDIQTLFKYINAFSSYLSSMKYLSNERVFLEITCIKLCTDGTEQPVVPPKPISVQSLPATPNVPVAPPVHSFEPVPPIKPVQTIVSPIQSPAPPAQAVEPIKTSSKLTIEYIKNTFSEFIKTIQDIMVRSLLNQAVPVNLDGIMLHLSASKALAGSLEPKKPIITDALLAYYKSELKPVFVTDSGDVSAQESNSQQGFERFKSLVKAEIRLID